jgi:hypothetical protein
MAESATKYDAVASVKIPYTIIKMVTQNREDAGRNIVRVPRKLIDGNKKDRNKFFRRELVTLVNKANGKKAYRHVVGDNRDYNLGDSTAAIDYEARDTLGLRRLDESVDVVVRRANLLDRWAYYWNSDDPAMQIANRMAVVALIVSANDIYRFVGNIASFVTSLFR